MWHEPPEEAGRDALTWGTLIVGIVVLVGLPVAILLLNQRKRNAGWWLLLLFVLLIVVGNAAEKLMTGYSPLF
jgi:hypothetical protein